MRCLASPRRPRRLGPVSALSVAITSAVLPIGSLGCAGAKPPVSQAAPPATGIISESPVGSAAPPEPNIARPSLPPANSQSTTIPTSGHLVPTRSDGHTLVKVANAGLMVSGGILGFSFFPILYQDDNCARTWGGYIVCHAEPEYPLRDAGMVQLGIGVGLLVTSGVILLLGQEATRR